MTQLGDAIARYHRIIESEPYRDMAWAHALHERMHAQNLAVGGKPVCPVLRPHFITRRQYTNLVKAAESLLSAVDRVETMAIGNPALMSRMEMLPAEKALAAVDPRYPYMSVTSMLDTHMQNGTLRFAQIQPGLLSGIAYGDALADLFFDAPPMKDFQKRYPLERTPGMKFLLEALRKAYHEFGGKAKQPNIAILEFRQAFQTGESGESGLMAEYFRREGLRTEIVAPEQLEYRNNVLRRGDFAIDLLFRRIRAQEFLFRYELSHPLLRAYRDGAVCMVNSFRSELAQKKAIFDLLTDDVITAGFPAAEKKAIRDFVPWTRMVASTKTTYQDQPVDLPEFILKNREKLVLRPNDDSTDQHAFHGAQTDDARWEKALKTALRTPYVVQETLEPVLELFPMMQYGHLEMRRMRVDLQPHTFLGKVQGCSSWLASANSSGFSTLSGVAPAFIIESK